MSKETSYSPVPIVQHENDIEGEADLEVHILQPSDGRESKQQRYGKNATKLH